MEVESEFSFEPKPTVENLECFVCPNPITPTDEMHIRTFISGSPISHRVLFNAHIDCFSRMAWSMMYYLFHYDPTLEEVVVQ